MRIDKRLPRHIVAVTSVLVLALGSAAIAADEVVVISDDVTPRELRVELGTTVRWQNQDDERHRLRSRDGPARLDSKDLEPGESWSHTFTVPGTYPYYDHRNRDDASYRGSVVVADDRGTDAATGPVERAEVTIVDDAFVTPTVSVTVGGTVEWINRGADEHTVTANDLSFDSGDLGGGASFSMVFPTPGRFDYFCAIHPEMQGTVDVVEADVPGDGDPIAPEGDPTTVELADAPPEPPTDDPVAESAGFTTPDLGSALESLATPPPE